MVCGEEPGRNPVRLRLSPEAPKAAGVAFLPGRCESVLCGLDLRVFRRAGTDLPKDAPEAVRRETALRLLDKMLSGTAGVRAIGLAADLPWRPGGGADVSLGIRASGSPGAVRPPGIPGGHLPERSAGGEPVRQGPELPDVLFVSLGTGWAARSSAANPLCRGRGGRPLGLGHVTICAGGRPCRCGGRGCLELYVRSPEVLKKLYHRTGLEASYADFCRITGAGK